MADVFISYAHENRDVVRELARSLSNEGFSVWWDRELSVGADLSHEIANQIEQCKTVVVVWSSAAVRSTWVIGEATTGLDAGKLIPMQIDDSRIPLPFGVCKTADMRGWPATNKSLELQNLMLSIKELVTGEITNEEDARILNDQLDPTVSIRVANRVKEAIQQIQPSADHEALSLRVELETQISNFALDILNDKSGRRVLEDFLSRLEPILRTSYINAWNKDTQIYGWDKRGLDLAEMASASGSLLLCEEVPDSVAEEYLSANRLKWAYVCRREGVYLSLGSLYSSSPIKPILRRLDPLCELLAKHESRRDDA